MLVLLLILAAFIFAVASFAIRTAWWLLGVAMVLLIVAVAIGALATTTAVVPG